MTKEPQQNIAIPKNVWHVLKIHCAKNDFVIKRFVTEAIEEKLERDNDNTTQTR
jgi:hypothetical protein